MDAIGPPSRHARSARAVAAELEAIFGRLPVRGPHPIPEGAAGVVTLGDGGAGRRGAWRMGGAILLTALVGIFAGLVLSDRRASPPAPAIVAAPPAVAAAPPAPLAFPSRPSAAVASDLLLRGPAPVVAPPPHRLAARPSASADQPRRRRIAAPGPASDASTCGRFASRSRRDWCDHDAVMAADRRLRRAYDHARRAGVSGAVLADYGDRWAYLLDRADRQPERVVAGYGALARDLERLSDDERPWGSRR